MVPLVIAPAAVVVSCSSTPVDQESHEQQTNFALSASKYIILQTKASLYGLKKPSVVSFDKNNSNLFSLLPSANFGFTTTITNSSATDANNDNKGKKKKFKLPLAKKFLLVSLIKPPISQ